MGRSLLAVLIVVALAWGAWHVVGGGRGGESGGALAAEDGPAPAVAAAPVTPPVTTPARTPPEAAALRALLDAGDTRKAVAMARGLALDRLADPATVAAAADAVRGLAAEPGSGPADRLVRADDARRLAGRLILECAEPPADMEALLDGLNAEVLRSGRAVPGATDRLDVPAGATLDGLLRGAWKGRVRVPAGFLLHLNSVPSASRLRPGPLTVPVEGIRLVVRKQRHVLRVLLGDVPYRAFPVGLGLHGRTPLGRFVVEERISRPDYWPPGGKRIPFGTPGNPLGTRWLGFQDTPEAQGYGVHGTSEPESIGKDLSQGCVRLLNADVEALFDWVAVGTEVEILP